MELPEYLIQTQKFHEKNYLRFGNSYQRKYPNENVIRFLTPLIKKKPLVLDLGCGNGRHIKLMKELRIKCHGLDFSKTALKITKKNIKSKSNLYFDALPNIKSVKPKTYDIAIDCMCSYTLRLNDFRVYIDNLSNVLKKNSLFYLETLSQNSDLFKNYKPSIKIDKISLNRILRKTSPFPKDNYLLSFYSKELLKKILLKHFKHLKIETISRTYRNNKEYFETLIVVAKKK